METLPLPYTNYHQTDPEEEQKKSIIQEKIFQNLKNPLCKLQSVTLTQQFAEAKTNEDKMKIVAKYYWSVLGPDNYIEQCFNKVKDQTNFKCSAKSEQFRTKGNSVYRNGDHQKALRLYTQGIAYAPLDSSELSLAYANRSAVLRSMRKCRECLIDVQRALSHGYLIDNGFKLVLRQMQCHRDLGNTTEMLASYAKASKLLAGLTEEKRETLQQQLEKEKQAPCMKVCTEQVIFPTEVPQLSYGANSEIVGASSAVRLEYNEQQGRHLVADRDIQIGDVLLVAENTVVAVMDKSKYDHCAHCQKPCHNLLPCPNCVWVLFCSPECQAEANKKYHNCECAAYSRFCHANGKVYIMGDNFDRIIRLLATIGVDNLDPYYKYAKTDNTAPSSDEDKRTKGFDSNGVFDPSNLDTIFNLITMNHLRDQRDLLDLSLFTLQIPRCFGLSLEHPDFFAVAGLCLQLQDTATLAAVGKSYYNFRSVPMELVSVAGCFNPLNSMLNHSCVSNLTFIHCGDKHISVAKWPIKKGAVLTESYHSFDLHCSKEERQKILKEACLFECKCEACENNWRFENMCISDQRDAHVATAMCYTHTEKVIVGMHMNFPPEHRAPIFTSFLKGRQNLLAKMWKKREFNDIRCQEIQYQVIVYQSLQGNRVVYPIKHSPRVLQDPVEVGKIIDSLMVVGMT